MVAIGRSEFRSNDEGITWDYSSRSMRDSQEPVIRGPIDPAKLPEAPEELRRDWLWDHVAMARAGFTVAVGHGSASATRQQAAVFVSCNRATTWHHVKPRFPVLDRVRHLTLSGPEPAEAYHSLFILVRNQPEPEIAKILRLTGHHANVAKGDAIRQCTLSIDGC